MVLPFLYMQISEIIHSFQHLVHKYLGPPRWLSGKEFTSQWRRWRWHGLWRSMDQEDPLEESMAPTPVFLPGESHGQRSLVGYSPWDHRVGHNRAHTHAISHCLHDILFIPSSVNGRLTIWVVSTFQLQWIMLLWTRVYKYGPESLLSLLLPRNEIAGFSGNSVFNGVRNHPTAFHNSCTIILMALNTIYQQMNSIQLHTFPEL